MKKFTIICFGLMIFLSSNAFSEETYIFQRMWPVMEGQWYFNKPSGVATDSNGFVYIADSQNDCIHKLNPDGKLVTKWGHRGSGNGEFWQPQGIAADSDDFIYVADSEINRIQKIQLLTEICCSLRYSRHGKRTV
ncbi:MAG: hypothetical protein HC887_00510 [Desulfobacteraceae bacterium]|nr:hypothetical protein [Desulfobacteraceae bacterium]